MALLPARVVGSGPDLLLGRLVRRVGEQLRGALGAILLCAGVVALAVLAAARTRAAGRAFLLVLGADPRRLAGHLHLHVELVLPEARLGELPGRVLDRVARLLRLFPRAGRRP